MQGLSSAARPNCSLTELPSGIYALQAKRTILDHPVWQRAWSNNERKEKKKKRGGENTTKRRQEQKAEGCRISLKIVIGAQQIRAILPKAVTQYPGKGEEEEECKRMII